MFCIEKQQDRLKKVANDYCFLTFVARFFSFNCMLFSLLCISLGGFCQPGGEIGISSGVGFYSGEYQARHFQNSQLYLSAIYRYNLNDRFAVRFHFGFSKIEVKDRYLFSHETKFYANGFGCHVKDLSMMLEFNFRSFMVRKTEESSWWSPYMSLGVGYLKADRTETLSIPLGVGVKFNLYRQLSCGIEWTTRKLFTDRLDGLEDPWKTGETNFLFNRDWFFVSGMTLTYRFPMSRKCRF